MKNILVLGIGSRIMMDDGIGIYLTEDLESFFENLNFMNFNIKFIIGETDVDYCLSEITKTKYIIVIDAFLSGKNSGEITVIPLCDLDQDSNTSYSLHDMHILNVINTAKFLKQIKQGLEGILIGVEPCEINFGFNLSDTLQSRYSNILKSVHKLIVRYINEQID